MSNFNSYKGNTKSLLKDLEKEGLLDNLLLEISKNKNYTERLNNLRRHPLDLKEPILNEERRLTVFPIKHKNIWKEYKKQLAAFWQPDEVDFSKDRTDFETLNEHEQHFLKYVLAFFAASDGIVNFNLEKRFTQEIENMEILIAYDYQKMMENIHGEVYSLMLDGIISDPKEREHLFHAIETIRPIKNMKDWAFKWIESDLPFAYRVLAFAIVEGVFFSGAFAAIYWFKKHNTGDAKLPGLIKSNQFIARDEGMHTQFACEVYSLLKHKLTQKEINPMIVEAVKISQDFVFDALHVDLIGMNKHSMSQYIEYVADRLLNTLGYKKVFKATNPFKFMESIGLLNKNNFFEGRTTEYRNATLGNKTAHKKFQISSDF